MAALTGLLGDYGSDDESAAGDYEVAGPQHKTQGQLSLCTACTLIAVLMYLVWAMIRDSVFQAQLMK